MRPCRHQSGNCRIKQTVITDQSKLIQCVLLRRPRRTGLLRYTTSRSTRRTCTAISGHTSAAGLRPSAAAIGLSTAVAQVCIAEAVASGRTSAVGAPAVASAGSSSCTSVVAAAAAGACLVAICGFCGVSSVAAVQLTLAASLVSALALRRADLCAQAFPRFCSVR